jgi:hypothetical protein
MIRVMLWLATSAILLAVATLATRLGLSDRAAGLTVGVLAFLAIVMIFASGLERLPGDTVAWATRKEHIARRLTTLDWIPIILIQIMSASFEIKAAPMLILCVAWCATYLMRPANAPFYATTRGTVQ